MKEIEIIQNSKFKFTLNRALKFVVENNKSINLPYHNLNHTLTMLRYFDEVKQNFKEITHIDIQLAILFHDFNHSGGKLTDAENIDLALAGLREFLNVSEDYYFERISEIIRATQYPYLDISCTQEQLLIRDLDLIGLFEPNVIQQNILGLSKELNIPLNEFLPNQINFMKNIKFNNYYFIENYYPKMKGLIEKMEYFNNLIQKEEII